MPYLDHNAPWLLDALRQEAAKTRELLRKLRHAVEQGQVEEPPIGLITELGRHASVLSHAIEQFTIRHDFILESGEIEHSEYESAMPFVAGLVLQAPLLLSPHTYDTPRLSEYQLYRELGFSDREYKDLLNWKQSWEVHRLDIKGAFNVFANEIVSDLQAARYSIKVEDIVPGVAGVVGIALDIVFFVSSNDIHALVTSCSTGLAAIATKFPEVKRKLLERGNQGHWVGK